MRVTAPRIQNIDNEVIYIRDRSKKQPMKSGVELSKEIGHNISELKGTYRDYDVNGLRIEDKIMFYWIDSIKHVISVGKFLKKYNLKRESFVPYLYSRRAVTRVQIIHEGKTIKVRFKDTKLFRHELITLPKKQRDNL